MIRLNEDENDISSVWALLPVVIVTNVSLVHFMLNQSHLSFQQGFAADSAKNVPASVVRAFKESSIRCEGEK